VNDPLPPRPPDLRQLLEPMVRNGVDFVVIGGIAGIANGSSLLSYDLDLVYSRDQENVKRLVAALREIGVRLRGAPPELKFPLDEQLIENGSNFTFITPHGDLDVLGDVAGVKSYESLASHAFEKKVAGLSVRIASIDSLIAMKRAANRPKDRNMLEEYLVLSDERREIQEPKEG
jgi:predicted nucleotidyltransferase